MPVCCAIFHASIPIGIQGVANPRDLKSLIFYMYGSTAQWTVALKRLIFKWKKVFANLGLGLIYYSIATSQSPSHDTVPLS
jgi:hypothetical protein